MGGNQSLSLERTPSMHPEQPLLALPIGHNLEDMTMEQTSEARLREALERLMDTLDGLRNGTLTKLEADEIQAAIEEALRVQRFSANH
jgi:hypothetical protein